MAEKNLYLIRHGKASMDGSDRERVLDSDGIIQASSLCEKIKRQFENKKIRIISSPFKRAVESLMPLKKEFPSIKINETEYLKEIKIGKSDDLSKHQIIAEMWKSENFKIFF